MSRGALTAIIAYMIGIFVVVTGFFLLHIEKVALNFWALGFMVSSFIISLLATLALIDQKKKKDHMYYAAGLSSIIWIYQIVVIVSILFTPLFLKGLYQFIFLQIAINAGFFVIAFVVRYVSERVYENNVKTDENLKNGEYNKPKRGGF